jgi:hypothetical protein
MTSPTHRGTLRRDRNGVFSSGCIMASHGRQAGTRSTASVAARARRLTSIWGVRRRIVRVPPGAWLSISPPRRVRLSRRAHRTMVPVRRIFFCNCSTP